MTHPEIITLLNRAISERNDPHTGQGGQSAVAKLFGCSPALLTQVRKGTIPLSMALEAKILEHFGTDLVECPELGDITHAICAEEKRKPWSTSRHRQHRACRDCERRKS